MIVVFLPIVVADTKVFHDYNFVAPIKCALICMNVPLRLNFKSV